MKTKEYINQNIISEQEYDLIMEIVKLRMSKNLTQKELSNITGIPQPNIRSGHLTQTFLPRF